MRFYSTRDIARQSPVDLKTALLTGLAPDGGLYQPERIPVVDAATIARWCTLTTFADLASAIAAVWFADDIAPQVLERIVREAYDFSAPLHFIGGSAPSKLGTNPIIEHETFASSHRDEFAISRPPTSRDARTGKARFSRAGEHHPLNVRSGACTCELFHGPSLSFKDFAAQVLMRLLDYLLARDDEEALLLTATSGDTGGAVAAACHGRARIRAVICYPRGRISALQERQIATWGGNVQAIAVDGTFDDCQRLVKEALRDPRVGGGRHVTSANSINVGRLLPQTFYYWFAALQATAEAAHPEPVEGATFVVPSGNFGNLTAGVLAQRMGAPIGHFVAATNLNDAIPRFLRSGNYEPHATQHTLSNAMDVGSPSNFERLKHLYNNDLQAMRSAITGIVVTDEQTKQTMRTVWEKHRYLLDPHAAVAWCALEQLLASDQRPATSDAFVVLATAHPAKFPDIVQDATGQVSPVPASLQICLTKSLQSKTLLSPTIGDFLQVLKKI